MPVELFMGLLLSVTIITIAAWDYMNECPTQVRKSEIHVPGI